MDVLSDALCAVRLEVALFLNGEFHAPWCVGVPKGADNRASARVGRPAAGHLPSRGRGLLLACKRAYGAPLGLWRQNGVPAQAGG